MDKAVEAEAILSAVDVEPFVPLVQRIRNETLDKVALLVIAKKGMFASDTAAKAFVLHVQKLKEAE